MLLFLYIFQAVLVCICLENLNIPLVVIYPCFPRCGLLKCSPHLSLSGPRSHVYASRSYTKTDLLAAKFLRWLFSLLITKMSASSSRRAVDTFLGLPAHRLKLFRSENKQFSHSISQCSLFEISAQQTLEKK